ncbi:MAG: N-glycosylase/DNA lyase [Endomicrobia bacterium]|nr:N-glycosylase/DNA lyase [Endomicrobiia bacterium]
MKSLLKNYKFYYKKIQEKKREFLQNIYSKNKVFQELCFCLLTPQSKATKCWLAIEEMFREGFPKCDKSTVESILRPKVRFYKNKTKYLFEVAKKFDLIYKIIGENFEPRVLRKVLVEEIKGLGLKEASHFLRNIGYSFDLAILDRHILKNLIKLKVIKTMPKSLKEKEYITIEQKFINFSKKIKIPLVDLDLLLWAKQTGFVFK